MVSSAVIVISSVSDEIIEQIECIESVKYIYCELCKRVDASAVRTLSASCVSKALVLLRVVGGG